MASQHQKFYWDLFDALDKMRKQEIENCKATDDFTEKNIFSAAEVAYERVQHLMRQLGQMAGYTREFLISAFLSRYYSLPEDKFFELELMAETFYNDVGRDKFRLYCSLDADAIKLYKATYGQKISVLIQKPFYSIMYVLSG